MANGYVPHFMRPNPIMFPGIPPAQPHVPRAAPPPRARDQHPDHPSHDSHFHPPNYAHVPPGHHHHGPGNALPAPNAGGQFYQSSLNDHGHLFSPRNPDTCLFPQAFPQHGPNIFQRFWIALFSLPINALLSVAAALKYTYTFCADDELRGLLLSTLFTPSSSENHTTMGTLILSNSWSLLIGLLVVVAFAVASWFLAPKGENLTIWRSTLILSAASCYLMWAITFLAQWHPLIEPKMTKLRPGYVGGS